MPQNPARTARTRAEILGHAGRLFRLRGYAGTNIDDVMLAAGLTRGAFYAHFKSKAELVASAPGCVLASLPSDVARAPLIARLAYANLLHATIAELARGRRRKLDADATVVAILAVGAVTLARASGDTRLGDWLLRCAGRAALPLLKPRASPAKRRSRSRRKVAGARRAKPAARSRGGRAAAGPKARS